MDFKSKAIDIDTIRVDGGTQVREQLDEDYVVELCALFEDNRHGELPAVVVYRDDDGLLWLADGFHRYNGAKRAGSQTLRAEIRSGSLEEAKLYAAQANTRNGMRLNAGDKTRAVLLADKSARKLGRPMGVRELARHVGCSHTWVSKALGVETSCHGVDVDEERATHKRSVALLWARIEAAICANPERTCASIASEIGCIESVVRDRRKAIGLPPISKGAGAAAKGQAKRDAVRKELASDPDATNKAIAERVGQVAMTTVADVRAELGLPPRAPGGSVRRSPAPAADPPSAPEQHEKDQRSKPEVIQAHPKANDGPKPPVAAIVDAFEAMDTEDRYAAAIALSERFPDFFDLATSGSSEAA